MSLSKPKFVDLSISLPDRKSAKGGRIKTHDHASPNRFDVVAHIDGAYKGSRSIGGWAYSYTPIHKGFSYLESGRVKGTTNQRMELQSAISVLRSIFELNPTNSAKHFHPSILIISDSKYTINTCNEWLWRWKEKGWRRKLESEKGEVKNLDLVKELHDLIDGKTVHFRWVKGHSGDMMNEICDALACAACHDVVISPIMVNTKDLNLESINRLIYGAR